jgi:succinate-semialdehyde dehydrogenase/glutarate-semialdehyde dehydrogenase
MAVTSASLSSLTSTGLGPPAETLNELIDRSSGTGAEMPLPSPWTHEPLGAMPAATPADVRVAAERARRAQARWAAVPLRERTRVLRNFHDLVLARQEQGLDLIQLESGKSRAHAFEEIADAAIVSRYYARSASRHLRPRRRAGALPLLTSVVERHAPRGVVGVIAPWNYPLSMGITDALPALVAGNAVLIKPDAQTSLTALWAACLLDEAGLPQDLLHILPGRGSELGPALLDEINYLCFTGSTSTGRLLAAEAGQRLVECSLELGGKNAMLILDDADMEVAVDGAVRGCYASAGQLCVSMERIYVAESRYDEFVSAFSAATENLRLGIGLDWSYDIGSLISSAQLRTVRRHVDDAIARGATVQAGGHHRSDIGPYVFEPTVLTGVTPDMELHSEETFGPVVSVAPFGTDQEAVARANASVYGLNASIYTTDPSRGRELAAALRCGTVNVNDAYVAAWASVDAPMGGVGASGMGRRHGAHGIQKYTDPQTVARQRLMPLAPPAGMSAEAFSRLETVALRMMRRLPGRH